ncbi:MAG TPA: class I SAM-dependent methyltransferase [Thermoflexia bacterium]|jgi:ubiquinone/menaquinone biosynthesis C-methylase UbiE|nr:class I SAM-dependent methyltransferase [Thermoflexia bacterium]
MSPNVFDGLASGYDLGMWPLERAILHRLRRRAFSIGQGSVLELGVGTGVNLPFYGSEARVTAMDASPQMLRHAARRRTRASVRFVQADVHHLPFADGSFDAVTGSLLFCSVEDPSRALAEVRRALRPGGRLILIEHTRGTGLGAWLTDRLHPLWYRWNGVCRLNRETTRAVIRAGFQEVREERHLLGIVRRIEGVK